MTDATLLLPLPAILLGWALMGGTPGPATLAISATAMARGRGAALRLATGVVLGSAAWGAVAGLGLAAAMLRSAWTLELVRYLGAAYLGWLAVRALRAAWRGAPASPGRVADRPFARGLLLHLTNPKAVLGWGSVYAVALAPGAGPAAVGGLYAALLATSGLVFWGYALAFSSAPVARAYARARRGFEAAFGLLFGGAALGLLAWRPA